MMFSWRVISDPKKKKVHVLLGPLSKTYSNYTTIKIPPIIT